MGLFFIFCFVFVFDRMAEGVAKSKSVIARYNLMLSNKRNSRVTENDTSTDSARRRDPDATDFHVSHFFLSFDSSFLLFAKMTCIILTFSPS